MVERLKQLEKNVAELRKLRNNFTEADVRSDITKQWALRYGMLESIQIIIDISCHKVVQNQFGNPDTNAECVELLAEYDYLDESLKKKLIKMIGLPNILVHEYINVDVSRLYNLLDNLDDFRTFASIIKQNE